MSRRLAVLGLAAAVLGSAMMFAAMPSAPVEAASRTASFIVPSNDGYGVGDCAIAGGSCGKVVADQWCEAQGYGRSVSVDVADAAEVTGAVTGKSAHRPIAITCAD